MPGCSVTGQTGGSQGRFEDEDEDDTPMSRNDTKVIRHNGENQKGKLLQREVKPTAEAFKEPPDKTRAANYRSEITTCEFPGDVSTRAEEHVSTGGPTLTQDTWRRTELHMRYSSSVLSRGRGDERMTRG